MSIITECPTFLKKQNMGLSISWYEFNNESDGQGDNNVIAFTHKYYSCSESGDEDMFAIEVAKTYRKLLIEWKDCHIRE